jgi:hypothetical protein
VILNFNNKMSTAAVFLDIKKPFTQHGTLACYISCQIGIFDKLNQAYWLFLSTMKIQCFGRRRNVYTKGNASRVAIMFGPVHYSLQYVHK